jgi:hypothetical protein
LTYAEYWFPAFALTVAVEVPLVVVLTKDSRRAWLMRTGVSLFAQLMTHPIVWFVFPMIPGMTRYRTLTLAELWAWLAEAALYAVTAVSPSVLRAVAVSALANGASLAIGFVFF